MLTKCYSFLYGFLYGMINYFINCSAAWLSQGSHNKVSFQRCYNMNDVTVHAIAHLRQDDKWTEPPSDPDREWNNPFVCRWHWKDLSTITPPMLFYPCAWSWVLLRRCCWFLLQRWEFYGWKPIIYTYD